MKGTAINKHHHITKELDQFVSKCRNECWARKMRGISMALSGMSRTEAARSQGVSAQALRAWIIMYNMVGIEGLLPCLRVGRGCRLSEEDTRELVTNVVLVLT